MHLIPVYTIVAVFMLSSCTKSDPDQIPEKSEGGVASVPDSKSDSVDLNPDLTMSDSQQAQKVAKVNTSVSAPLNDTGILYGGD